MNKKYTPFMISIISLFTTFWMFSKLQRDYSMLQIIKIPEFALITTKEDTILNIFNIYKNEYVIGLIILLFCVIVSLFYIIDEYHENRRKQK